MTQRQLTGSRLRARRLDMGLRQADLAAQAGISASYLNLIEHNRRRIGGRLLRRLAEAMQADPAVFTEEAEAALMTRLRAAAAARGDAVEMERVEDFAGRFPGWAGLVAAQDARLSALERQLRAARDRMAHDPALAASLLDVISAATAIRSTAAILVGGEEIDADWQRRFHGNIHQDSQRLADASRALAGYLDAPADGGGVPMAPVEEVEAFLAARSYHLPELERPDAPPEAAAALVAAAAPPLGRAAADLALAQLDRYRDDALALPRTEFAAAAVAFGHDPAKLAGRFGVGLDRVFRRLAALPDDPVHPPRGLAVCDAAGAILMMKPVAGFSLPRGAAACPLWPLYQALSGFGQPLRRTVALPGETAPRLDCYAIGVPRGLAGFNRAAPLVATMLVMPATDPAGAADPVGPGCRFCPRAACTARREPSAMATTEEGRAGL